jgi:hypothetical protein
VLQIVVDVVLAVVQVVDLGPLDVEVLEAIE